ncbi:MAG: ATP-binding protein, partial [Cyclobacteriaceae bacterium]
MINLVSNAIKFTDEGGVELKLFLDDTARPRNPNDIVLKFEIIDTGIGIPKEKQHMVFEYFTQTDSS